MKQGHFFTRIIATVFMLFIVGYMGVQMWRWVYDPIRTVSAVYIESADAVELDGVIVRDEKIVTTASPGALDMELDEGERAGKGDIIAAIYASEKALDNHRKMLETDARIEQMNTLINQGNEILDIATADRAVSEQVQTLMDMVSRNDFSKLNAAVEDLKNKTLSRVYIYEDRSGLREIVDHLRVERKNYASNAAVNKKIYAPAAGYFSHNTDGYEGAFSLDAVDEWTPAQLESLLKKDAVGTRDSSVIGKIILDYKWKYVALVDEKTAEYIGDVKNVTLRFEDGNLPEISARIDRISPAENGKVLISVVTTEHIADFTLQRFVDAQLVLKTYKGLKVPREALRVSESGENGVYCLIDSQAKFKPVEPIFEKDSYYIVAYDPKKTESLLLYDEIIVAAKELENRKIVK